MSNILEKFKNVTHFKVKRDNLLRHTLTLFHLFLNAQNIFQGASRVVTQHLAHCLLPFASSTVFNCSEHLEKGCLRELGGNRTFLLKQVLAGRVRWREVSGCHFSISGTKSTICHPGTLLCYIVSD